MNMENNFTYFCLSNHHHSLTKTFFMEKGHPKALYYLFFVELWERFAYYGMRALLVLYIVKELYQELGEGTADARGFAIYAAFGALVYATPVLGGMIADRYLGYRKAIINGSIMMAIGLFLMAVGTHITFYVGLGFLVTGNGLFKPNISSMVGGLYPPGDPRRDAGFTIFYMGINLGAFISPLACGYVAEVFGRVYGFGLAGVGMIIGLLVFQVGIARGVFGTNGAVPDTPENKEKAFGFSKQFLSVLLSYAAVPLLTFMVYKSQLAGYLLYTVLALVVFVVGKSFLEITRQEREKIIAIFILAFFSTIFWAFFEQAGSTITLFAERNVNLVFMNAEQSNSINPLFIILLAVPTSMFWTWLAKMKMNPYTPYKFAMGIAQLGLGFLVFALGARFVAETGEVPLTFLIVGYFLITTGELFISPIGLSMVTRLSPAKVVSFMMGVWFLSMSFAQYIAGFIARFTTRDFTANGGILERIAERVTGLSPEMAAEKGGAFMTLLSYTNVFSSIAIVAFVTAIMAAITAPLIRRLMHGEH
jgi:proton-dependent oligopeptide transporter, POT family